VLFCSATGSDNYTECSHYRWPNGPSARITKAMMIRAAVGAAVLSTMLLATGLALAQQGDVRRVHDPCIIAAGGSYYVFCTGGGIPIRRSKDLIHWERIGSVFQDIPGWNKDEVPGVRGLWAPDISFFNGQYHLYYAVSTFGSNRSCIGLATNATLDPNSPNYKWVDQGKVIGSTRTDNWNAIDPNIVFDEQRQPWMAFGSFWSGIKLVRIDRLSGKPQGISAFHDLAARSRPGAIEAPFMIRREGFYYLFVSFDFCARGVDSTYKIMVGRSEKIIGPFLDKDGKSMLYGGGTLVLASQGHVRGPGHNAALEEKCRTQDGIVPSLRRPLAWRTGSSTDRRGRKEH
jgi:arabinan endo-1,5-alpha-L-arabinosidase